MSITSGRCEMLTNDGKPCRRRTHVKICPGCGTTICLNHRALNGYCNDCIEEREQEEQHKNDPQGVENFLQHELGGES